MRALLILLALALAGCTPTGGPSDNTALRPDARTNQVAMTNLNLAIEYMRNGNLERALDRLNRAHDADPGYYATHNAYGLLYQRLGDKVRAEQHFKRAVALNPNDSQSKNNYGNFLCQNDRYDEAETVFLQAAANPLYETPEIAWTNAGTCADVNLKTELAEQYFRKALTINPRVPSALIQMARISYEQQNYLSARGYLQRYQEVARHTAASLLLGIRIERELGDRDALASYELMLRNGFPDSVELQELRRMNGS